LQENKLGGASGSKVYKRKIEHAGYQRYIIHRNPPKLDEEGDVIEDENEDDVAGYQAAEDNPYADIRLEELLCPLTSAADLPTHPSLSQPYLSTALTEMVDIARANQHKEKATLARMSLMLTNFRGDVSWAPGGMFHTTEDEALLAQYERETEFQLDSVAERWSDDAGAEAPNSANEDSGHQLPDDGETNSLNDKTTAAGSTGKLESNGTDTREGVGDEAQPSVEKPNASAPGEPGTEGSKEDNPATNGDTGADEEDTLSQQTSHRMTTRAKAHQSSHTPQPPDSPDSLPIHPIFQVPATMIPDLSCGLPPQDAEEMRRLLVLYVQKQEEVVRQTEELSNGLMKAERMRMNVLSWTKAEAHVGEMSDGEDWYDKEEWGLTEDLVKGKGEVAEEEDVRESKKTRGRRN
jgi:hypothetical protein